MRKNKIYFVVASFHWGEWQNIYSNVNSKRSAIKMALEDIFEDCLSNPDSIKCEII